jgi:hypothetical protein
MLCCTQSRGKGTSNIRCQDGGVDLGRTYACHCHAKGEISRHLDLVNSRGDSAGWEELQEHALASSSNCLGVSRASRRGRTHQLRCAQTQWPFFPSS